MDYDVIIVGSRVAGAILATLLGELGHRVLVLDRTTFPSDTLSTYFFRAPALRAFRDIGVLDDVHAVVLSGIRTPPPLELIILKGKGNVKSGSETA